jgi:signal transduction histidine kinase
MVKAVTQTFDPGGKSLPAQWEEQLESIYAMSVEIAGLRQTSEVMDRALDYALMLTGSSFGFVGLNEDGSRMDVAAIKGFAPSSDRFYPDLRSIPVRPSVFGIVVLEGRPHISNNVAEDRYHVGVPRGHPPVNTFLGVPLQFRNETIGMVGVANRASGYDQHHERLLSTFANQVAVAIANARMYERQREMISDLRRLYLQLDEAHVEAMLHEERTRIAEGLHDRVAQILFSIGISANAGEKLAGEDTPVGETFARITELANRGVEEVRRTVYDLAAGDGVRHGLVDNLRELVLEFDGTGPTRFTLSVDGRERRLTAVIERTLMQVAAEALLNIRRHANAHAAIISLRFQPDRVELAVQDDGVGLPAPLLTGYRNNPGHFGLSMMARRLETAGGSLQLDNSDDGGLLIRASVPLPGKAN